MSLSKAVHVAIQRAPQNTHLVIFTDSKYAINCLTDWVVSSGTSCESVRFVDAS